MRYRQFCIVIFIIASILFGNGTLPSQLSKIILVSGGVLSLTHDKSFWYSKVYFFWSLSFTALCFLSMTWTVCPSLSWEMLHTILYAQVCGLSLYVITQENASLLYLTNKILVVSSILLFVRFVSIYGFDFDTDIRNAEDMEMSMNTIGMICSFGCIISYYCFKYQEKKLAWFFFSVVLLFMAILSGSRKALLIPVIAYTVQQLLSGKKRAVMKKAIWIILGVALIWLLVMNIPFFYEMTGHRFESMLNGVGNVEASDDVDSSTTTRARLIEYGLFLYQQNPIWGYGIHAFKYFHGTYYAHNNYVELLVALGIVGVILYYSIYVYIGIKLYLLALQKKDSLAITYLSIIVGILISHYGWVGYYSLINTILLAVSACYALNYKKLSKRII